ncbi:MAG TPA: fibronectin type III domain-containing protein, partial [bacterium]|nr:fibronectin type III domain-containing protein [bacterium]
GKVVRLTNNRDSKSWAQYSPDGSSIYFLDENSGDLEILKMELSREGIPVGEPASIAKGLGTITSLVVRPAGLYFTANLSRRIFNLFQSDPQGKHVVQLTNTYTDVLNVSLDSNGGKYYAVCYQKGAETLYAFDAPNLEKTDWAPGALAAGGKAPFISNSFEEASKLIQVHPVKDPPKEFEPVPGEDRDDPEIAQEKKAPTRPPASVSHLELTEASNLVQLQWPVSGADEEGVESYHIYRSTSAGATFSYLGSTSNTRQGQYVDYDVKDNGTYFYYVTAVNKLGESDPSPVVEAHPSFKVSYEDYRFSLTPDILLFLAGYDSSFGFVGGGVVQMSDYLGDHRIALLGDTIPGVRTGLEANYEFSQWRTTVDLDYFYYQNYFNIYDLQSGNIVNQYRNNENGFTLNFSYPIDT